MRKNLCVYLFVTLLCCFTVFAGNNKDTRVHPDNATHFIKGYFSANMVDGKPVYKLSDVSTQGITFAGSDFYNGKLTEIGDLQFTFDSVRTTYPGGFRNNDLAFWYYDKEIGEWQPDIETRQATGSFEDRKIKTIMLVLDCSTSLDKDFSKVKASAKSFLQKLYTVSNTGNVRVGIIGFSSLSNTNKSILPIQPLNSMNYSRMMDFIGKLNTANGTALYYSIDKAVTMMDSYANSLQGEDFANYSGSCLVTFTDGIDQTSQDPSQGILNADAYYERVKNEVIMRPIRGSKVDNYFVAVQGVDITSEAMAAKFDRVLSGLTDNYMKITQFSELKAQFEKIADDLINSWQLLNCYVPAARQGLVCWTLGEAKPEKQAKEKTKTMLLGLQAGVGAPFGKHYYGGHDYTNYYEYYWGVNFQLGFDFAYPITDKFGLGIYWNLGNGFMNIYANDEIGHYDNYDIWYYLKFTVGINMTFGNINDKGAFLLGVGSGILLSGPMDIIPIDLRLGGVFKNGFYFFTSFTNDFNPMLEPSIHFGYNFGNLFKVK